MQVEFRQDLGREAGSTEPVPPDGLVATGPRRSQMGNLLWKRKKQQVVFFFFVFFFFLEQLLGREREGRWVNSGATNASMHPLDRDCPCLEQPPPGHPLRPQTDSSALLLLPNIAARERRRGTEKRRPWCKDATTSWRQHPRSPLKACPAVEALGMFCCCPCSCWCNALHGFERTWTAFACS